MSGEAIRFTRQQQAAFDDLMAGVNVMLIGRAGTGKSTVLDAFLRQKGEGVVACAPTGIAALNLPGGSTIHRAFGLRSEPVFDPTEHRKRPGVLKAADAVVIDEASMCRCDLFDAAAGMILEAARERGRPIQTVVVGDFAQLPPIIGREELAVLRGWYPRIRTGFCVGARRWGEFGFVKRVLDEVVRQKDRLLIDMLNLARVGDPACLGYFNGLVREPDPEAIVLVPRNREADEINAARLAELSGEARRYSAIRWGTVGAGDRPAPDDLELKAGARVMAVANIEGVCSNGSLGTVEELGDEGVRVAFDAGESALIRPREWQIVKPSVKTNADGSSAVDRDVVGTYEQIPLKLAYAVTIHKSQGQTYEKVHIHPGCFAPGQLYVALSRCTCAEGLSLAYPAAPWHLIPPGGSGRG